MRRDILERAERVTARLEAGGAVEGPDVDAIERLGRVLAAVQAAKPPRRRRPARAVATAFLATAAVVGVLLFARCDRAEIALDVRASEVEFVLAETQNVVAPLAATRLALEGTHRVQVPPGFPATRWDQGEADSVLLAAAQPRTLTLNALQLPSGTRVRIHQPEDDAGLRVRISNPTAPLRLSITLPADVTVESPGPDPAARLALGRERPIEVTVRAGQVLEVTARDTGLLRFAEELPVTGVLGLHRLRDEEGVRRRPVSTVAAGVLILEELGDRRHELRSGEHLQVVVQSATIERLAVAADGVALRLRGTAHMLAAGGPGNTQNLMPRWIEWLRTQQEVVLFGGVMAYLFGLLMAFMKWVGLAE